MTAESGVKVAKELLPIMDALERCLLYTSKKRITQAEAKSLCSTGKSTSKLDGFVSKKGSNFSCWLYVKADGSIGFDFSDDGREATSDNLVNLRKSQSK